MESTGINSEIINKAIDLGFCEDETACAATLQEAVRLAAPFTHPSGNLRSEDWVLKVEDGVLVDLSLVQCDTCKDTGYVFVGEVCPRCDGEGCKWCKDDGSIPTRIRCQDCNIALDKRRMKS